MNARGGPRAPARAFHGPGGVSEERPAIFTPGIWHHPEGSTPEARQPPNLLLPPIRRRYTWWAASLAFHGALLAFVVLQGDRLWRRTLAPGAPSLFLLHGGGGG